MSASTPGDLFREGKLADAIAAGNAAVRATPGDVRARTLLAELLLFAGNYERADVVLDAAAEIDPQAVLVVAEFRQLLRAEMARRQLYRDGRLPEFLGEPTASMRHALAALVALRAGDTAAAEHATREAEAARPRVAGAHAGAPFDDFRDADDLTAGYVEILTTTGKYFWIPTERVIAMTFHPPKRPRDLFWRRVSMEVREGPDGDVYMPALYVADDATSDLAWLGRATDWIEIGGPALVRGGGQRLFLVGDDAVGVMDFTELTFS